MKTYPITFHEKTGITGYSKTKTVKIKAYTNTEAVIFLKKKYSVEKVIKIKSDTEEIQKNIF